VNICSRTAPSGGATPVPEETKLPGPTRGGGGGRTKLAELLADVFLATTDVGRMSGPTVAGDGDGEASEWEDREREEQLTFLRGEEKRLGAGD